MEEELQEQDDESGTGVKGIQRHPMAGPHVCRLSDWNRKCRNYRFFFYFSLFFGKKNHV
jgi:hypothetical protein